PGAIPRAALPRPALRMPRLRVTGVQVRSFYEVLRKRTGDELFGFFARPVPVGAYATLGRLLTRPDVLGTALDELIRFYRLFDPHPYLHVSSKGRIATLRLEP